MNISQSPLKYILWVVVDGALVTKMRIIQLIIVTDETESMENYIYFLNIKGK
jgi:hypothetical protein